MGRKKAGDLDELVQRNHSRGLQFPLLTPPTKQYPKEKNMKQKRRRKTQTCNTGEQGNAAIYEHEDRVVLDAEAE